MNKILIFLFVVMIFLFGCGSNVDNSAQKVKPIQDISTIDNVDEEYVVIGNEIKTLDDGTKYLVHPDKIRKGIARPGDVRDVIPSIDDPNYVSLSEVDWIGDDELVLAIIHKGIKRVYPLQILVFHEIVNEVIEGDPLLITYCPLCGSGIAYERKILVDGQEKIVEFGTSGKLFNSNLVMYDRETDTYWQQIDGKAIVGELTGQELKEVSIDTVSWKEWKENHPDSEVLTKPRDENGYLRSYGQDPYGSYYVDSNLFFPVENEDESIHPKTVIFGIEVDGVYKAYKEEDLKTNSEIKDEVNGIKLTITRDDAGIVKVTKEDGTEIVKERDFWFVWYAFHPETLVYGG